MEHKFAARMNTVHKSYVREILKATQDPEIISFAGGLPNPKTFPVNEFAAAAEKVLKTDGANALQYSTTEGYLPLRKYISDRYAQEGLDIPEDQIVITNGSQQALDLLAKIFIEKGDGVVIERPGYLGAIQAFSVFEPKFLPVELESDGVDIDALKKIFKAHKAKLFYAVTNFQNPSGISYSEKKREQLSEFVKEYGINFIEDNPYGELRFIGEKVPLAKKYLGDYGIVNGSFSKIVAPGLRLGWITGSKDVIDKIVTVKQASDLHTNYFSQRVVYQYLTDNDINGHITKIRKTYGAQRDYMVRMIEKYLPKNTVFTRPEGGMFIWMTLPKGISSLKLAEECIKRKVIFVPGVAFYVDGGGLDTLRLNYSNSNEAEIEEGMKRFASALESFAI